MQGHPESGKLWQDFINGILLNKIGFKNSVHEPCLYQLNRFGEKILLLRQVDDFALACDSEETANRIWDLIKNKLVADLDWQGLIQRFNGIDVQQHQDYIHINCKTYIDKITRDKPWLTSQEYEHNNPIPMNPDSKYMGEFDLTEGPVSPKECAKLEQEMEFKYRAATGELIFAMVTCQPDIAYAVHKVSQYNAKPAQIH